MSNCVKKLLKTDNKDYSSLILRIALGTFIFAHGAQKMFGMFGGNGFEATMGFFTDSMGIPYIIALLVIIGEGIGSIALIFGFLTRFVAASIGIILVGAIFMVHFKDGFYTYEPHFLGIAIVIVLIIKGSGALSVDNLLSEHCNRPKEDYKD